MLSHRSIVKKMRDKDIVFQLYCNGMNMIPDFQDNRAKQLALEENFAMFFKRMEIDDIDT
jgi:hypothetical protein